LDAVRAAAVVAVVALHAGMPYLTHPMPGLTWSVRDSASPTVDFAFWSIELVVMPLFLIIAGYLAAQTIQRRGPIGLVRNRGKRLLIPLLFGIIVVLPLGLYAWVLGWVTEGLVSPVKLRSLKFDGVIDHDLWGLRHLWFLQYLFQYIVVLAIGWAVVKRSARLRRLCLSPRICSSPQTLAWMMLAIAMTVLWFRPQVVWGFQHAFAPVLSKWIYHGTFFVAGVGVAFFDPRWSRMQSIAIRWTAPAIAIGIAAVLLGQWHLTHASESLIGERQLAGFSEFTLAAMTATAAMTISCFAIAIAVGRVRRLSRTVEYLAAASFWVYLVHHPVLGLVHIDLKYLWPGISPVIKAVAAAAIAIGVSLLTYEGLVRRTTLGRWLGMTYQFASPSDWSVSVTSASQPPEVNEDAGLPSTISIQMPTPMPADEQTRRAA
jgi:peptidoglycan/LPS O-acetylase OafA/YrhL